MSTLPADWLYDRTSIEDVEEDLAELGASDFWLRQWREMLTRFCPGDELWTFGGELIAEPFSEECWREHGWQNRFALVRDGEVMETVSEPW